MSITLSGGRTLEVVDRKEPTGEDRFENAVTPRFSMPGISGKHVYGRIPMCWTSDGQFVWQIDEGREPRFYRCSTAGNPSPSLSSHPT